MSILLLADWAGFVLMGESAVAPGLRISGDAKSKSGGDGSNSSPAYSTECRDLQEEPDPAFNGAVSTTRYTTSMTVPNSSISTNTN